MAEMSLSDLRVDYHQGPLEESQMARDPFDQLKAWLSGAIAAKIPDPNAMTLATVNAQGQPAARIVLLRDIKATGLTFYTHHRSRKGHELAANPRVAATLFWASLQRQVRIEGCVEKLSDTAADAYFEKRPYETRLGAWASPQSETIAGRHVLIKEMERLRKRFPDGKVPRPPHWGGYQLMPHCFEFWQGRPHRLNDRLLYTHQDANAWILSRLAP